MKNQYFGDNKDLFKYDLVMRIFQDHLVNRFTFIPMLTETDDRRNPEKPGTGNKELVKFLDACIRRRNIKELKSLFKKKRISMEIYKEREHFPNKNRQEYFEQIRGGLLSKSLILVDPDTGLEVVGSKVKKSKKHLLYTEVENLYRRMDKSSILMIIQFIPRLKREKYFAKICSNLKEKVGNLPLYISDNQIAFFFLAKDESLMKSLNRVISAYTKDYSELYTGGITS